MATVEIAVGGRSYQIACEDGTEDQVAALARDIDERVGGLAGRAGAAGAPLRLVMAALLIAADLEEARAALAGRDADAAAARQAAEDAERERAELAAGLVDAAGRIEGLAAALAALRARDDAGPAAG